MRTVFDIINSGANRRKTIVQSVHDEMGGKRFIQVVPTIQIGQSLEATSCALVAIVSPSFMATVLTGTEKQEFHRLIGKMKTKWDEIVAIPRPTQVLSNQFYRRLGQIVF